MAQDATPTTTLFPSKNELRDLLRLCIKPSGGPSNGGLDNHVWVAIVDRHGIVRVVCYSGNSIGDQWPASRAVAIEKANTANAMSLPGYALSTANLYSGAQPGGYLYGIALTNPVDTQTMYAGDEAAYGTANDPMVGRKASGVVTFGGGLPLYDKFGVVGGLGVSGDTSCGDHNIAWRIRQKLGLDHVPAGPSDNNDDAMIYDIGLMGKSSSGYGHPTSGLKEDDVAADIGASAKG